jgi:hypothetical protein
MHEDISKLVRFKRDDAHRTGLPRHHTGTSSKRLPEAIRGGDMKARRRMEIIGTYLGGCHTERVSSTIYKQMRGFLQFFEIMRDKVRGRVPHGEQPNRRKAEYEPPMSFSCRICYTRRSLQRLMVERMTSMHSPRRVAAVRNGTGVVGLSLLYRKGRL